MSVEEFQNIGIYIWLTIVSAFIYAAFSAVVAALVLRDRRKEEK